LNRRRLRSLAGSLNDRWRVFLDGSRGRLGIFHRGFSGSFDDGRGLLEGNRGGLKSFTGSLADGRSGHLRYRDRPGALGGWWFANRYIWGWYVRGCFTRVGFTFAGRIRARRSILR